MAADADAADSGLREALARALGVGTFEAFSL